MAAGPRRSEELPKGETMKKDNTSEYVTISQFAQICGVSPQAVYKQINRKLSKYVNVLNNQKRIETRALWEVYGMNREKVVEMVKNITQPINNRLNQEENHADTRTIEKLFEELERKDKQIAELMNLLSQEQQLHALTQQKVALLEEKNAEPQEEPKKRGFWELFRKDKRAE